MIVLLGLGECDTQTHVLADSWRHCKRVRKVATERDLHFNWLYQILVKCKETECDYPLSEGRRASHKKTGQAG